MGRSLSGGEPEEAEEPRAGRLSGPRPRSAESCRRYLMRSVVREYPEIVQGFLKEAKRGGCQHVRMVHELLEAEAPKRRSKTVEALLKRMAG